MLILFHLIASTGRNVCRFSLNPNRMVKIRQAYRTKFFTLSVPYWLLYSRRDKETRKKIQLLKRERLHFGFWLGRQWNLCWWMDSQIEETVNPFLLDGNWTKQLLWERERLHFGFWLGSQLTLSWRIDSPTDIGLEGI